MGAHSFAELFRVCCFSFALAFVLALLLPLDTDKARKLLDLTTSKCTLCGPAFTLGWLVRGEVHLAARGFGANKPSLRVARARAPSACGRHSRRHRTSAPLLPLKNPDNRHCGSKSRCGKWSEPSMLPTEAFFCLESDESDACDGLWRDGRAMRARVAGAAGAFRPALVVLRHAKPPNSEGEKQRRSLNPLRVTGFTISPHSSKSFFTCSSPQRTTERRRSGRGAGQQALLRRRARREGQAANEDFVRLLGTGFFQVHPDLPASLRVLAIAWDEDEHTRATKRKQIRSEKAGAPHLRSWPSSPEPFLSLHTAFLSPSRLGRRDFLLLLLFVVIVIILRGSLECKEAEMAFGPKGAQAFAFALGFALGFGAGSSSSSSSESSAAALALAFALALGFGASAELSACLLTYRRWMFGTTALGFQLARHHRHRRHHHPPQPLLWPWLWPLPSVPEWWLGHGWNQPAICPGHLPARHRRCRHPRHLRPLLWLLPLLWPWPWEPQQQFSNWNKRRHAVKFLRLLLAHHRHRCHHRHLPRPSPWPLLWPLPSEPQQASRTCMSKSLPRSEGRAGSSSSLSSSSSAAAFALAFALALAFGAWREKSDKKEAQTVCSCLPEACAGSSSSLSSSSSAVAFALALAFALAFAFGASARGLTPRLGPNVPRTTWANAGSSSSLSSSSSSAAFALAFAFALALALGASATVLELE